MTRLYLRYRVRMLWGTLKPGASKDWGHRILIAFVVLTQLPVVAMMYWGIYGLCGTVVDHMGLPALTRLLHLPVAGFGVFLLFLVLNRVHPVLFEATDAELLGSLPVSARALAQARLTGLALLLAPILLLFLPFAVFYGLHGGAGLAYYLVAAILVALYALVVFGVGAVATCGLVLAVPAKPLRGLSRYGTAVVLIPAATATFMLMPRAREAVGAIDQILDLADRVAVGPVAWLVDSLAGAASGPVTEALLYGALSLAAAVVLWLLCLALVPRLARGDVVEAAPAQVGTVRGVGWWAPAWLGPASRALWRREMSALGAEAGRTILVPIGMLVFFIVLSRFTALPVSFMIGILSVSLVAGVTMSAVGQEGKGFWVVRSLPLSMAKVLLVKLVARAAVCFVIFGVLAAVVAVLPTFGSASRPNPIEGLVSGLVSPGLKPWLAGMAVCGLAICAAWGLAIGARFPVFEPVRKGQYVGVGAALAGTFGSYAILGSLVLSLLPLRVAALRPVLWFLPLAVLAFWVGVTALFLAWAAWHLERLET